MLAIFISLAAVSFLHFRYLGITVLVSFFSFAFLGIYTGLGLFRFNLLDFSNKTISMLLLMSVVLTGLNICYLFSEGEKHIKIISGSVAGLSAMVITFSVYLSGSTTICYKNNYTACQSNMKNISTALEMYSTDHKGFYPATLRELTPKYLQELPRCFPGNPNRQTVQYYRKMYGVNMEDYVYNTAADRSAYTFYCQGKNHSQINNLTDYPQYNSREGLISGK